MTWSRDLDSTTKSRIYVKLYRNVQNVPEIRQKVFAGQLQCCIIKPDLIVDPFQIVVAANKALVAKETITKTIFTEILYNLSISKNITKSLQTFGITDVDTNFYVATISEGEEDSFVYDTMKGEEIDVEAFKGMTNLDSVKIHYKLSESESRENNLLDSVVSRMAIKEINLS